MASIWFRITNVWRRRGHADIAATPSGSALYPSTATYPSATTYPKG